MTTRKPMLSALELDRRAALKLFGAGAALAVASCSRPDEEVVPYVEIPERVTPGIPLRFATALPLAGYARGVIVTSMEGRPIKIDGNPRHPASLGATDVFAEAELATLYDPDRSKAPRTGNRIASWSAFESALQAHLNDQRDQVGSGIALLTSRVTSPTLIRQIGDLTRDLPQAKWYRYEPVDDDAARQGAILAFGRPLAAIPRLRDMRVVLMLDADPIGFGPEQIRNARELVEARRSRSPQDFLRIYVAEPAWSLAGAMSDHRLALPPGLIGNVGLVIARELGAAVPDAPPLPEKARTFARAAAADLKSRQGAAFVLAGPRQPAEIHALCHWINAALHAPVGYVDPVDPQRMGHGEAIAALAADIDAGNVGTLIILGANPAYDAPRDLELADAIGKVPFSVQLGLHDDETAARATWHLPLSHPLESWSDLRAFDGTASVVQPLIQPLYDSRTPHQLLAILRGASAASSHDLVRETWRADRQSQGGSGNFEAWWRQTLEDGIVADTAAAMVAPPAAKLPDIKPNSAPQGFAVVLSPDPCVWDGSRSNNALLQECPKPFSKQVWGNVLHLAPADAQRLGVADGDVVRIAANDATVEAPILITDGQAEGIGAATLGYGRMRAGRIGNGIGFDAYPLRTSSSPWLVGSVAIGRTGGHREILRTQQQFALEGEAKDLQPQFDLARLQRGDLDLTPPVSNPPTLYPPPPHPSGTYQWAMAIDTTACIGCNACVIACQAENNVPIVGPAEVAEGRDMHWLRIDEYVVDRQPAFSPIPCMHCEHAPCEPVCPVAASIHDSEGLNVQVYNRCVGTRFCESNCPYKVRRFNFFGYADGQEYGGLGAPIAKAAFNPDVTVRARGVMEKCTYCVQRISRARRAAEKEDRTIRDGEMVTACQAACPTRAIMFGNLKDENAGVNAWRREPHSYALLGELGTRPRTTYLARLLNPNPDLAS